MTARDWRERAACRTADPRLFDPLDHEEIQGGSPHPLAHPRIQQAITVCDSCPVRGMCGRWATQTNQIGVWGGRYRRQTKASRSAGTLRGRSGKAAA